MLDFKVNLQNNGINYIYYRNSVNTETILNQMIEKIMRASGSFLFKKKM